MLFKEEVQEGGGVNVVVNAPRDMLKSPKTREALSITIVASDKSGGNLQCPGAAGARCGTSLYEGEIPKESCRKLQSFLTVCVSALHKSIWGPG